MRKDKTGGYNIQEILAEMKDEYWQGLEETEEEYEERLECITFLLGGETYAFETAYASEVIRIPKLVRLPRVQEIIIGVFNLRGEILAAMDIRSLLGLAPGEHYRLRQDHRPEVGQVLHRADREGVQGVESLSLDNFEPAVKSLTGPQREFIRGQITCEGDWSCCWTY